MRSFRGEGGRIWSYDESSPIGDPGGMGAVFEGSDESGGHVAVKRVRLPSDTEADRRRRDRELEIADDLIAGRDAGSSVEHLLLPMDRGLDGDDLLIVLPRGEESLNAAVARGAVDSSGAPDAIRQVVNGLIELAGMSILHRDLKPANVLRHEGRWKLADFGLARNTLEATGTYTFVGAGTAPYMAPEVWQFKPATVKSDLYALGIMAYELFAGVRPFNGPTVEDFMRQHLNDDPPELDSIDQRFQRIILRLLKKDPNERYQDARLVLEALDKAGPALDEDQQILLKAALEAETRRSAADAEERERQQAVDVIRGKKAQAQADFQEILYEAQERAAAAMAEARVEQEGVNWALRAGSAILRFELFTSSRLLENYPEDPLVSAWSIVSATWVPSPIIGNVVCEDRPAGLQLFLVQFRSSAMVGENYEFGPTGREHGFDDLTFLKQRPYMIHPTTHVWTMNLKPLSAADLVVFLAGEVERAP